MQVVHVSASCRYHDLQSLWLATGGAVACGPAMSSVQYESMCHQSGTVFFIGGKMETLYERLSLFCGQLLMFTSVYRVTKPMLSDDSIIIGIYAKETTRTLELPYSIATMDTIQFNAFMVQYIKGEGLI